MIDSLDLFSVQAYYRQFESGNMTVIPMKLEPCTKEMWSALGEDNIDDDFNDYQIHGMLCLDTSETHTIEGLSRTDSYS